MSRHRTAPAPTGWRAACGALLIFFHLTVAEIMGLDFKYHIYLLAAFFLLTGLASVGFPGTVGFVGYRRRDLAWPLALARLVRTGRWDVVHVHSPLPGSVARLAVTRGCCTDAAWPFRGCGWLAGFWQFCLRRCGAARP